MGILDLFLFDTVSGRNVARKVKKLFCNSQNSTVTCLDRHARTIITKKKEKSVISYWEAFTI